MANQITLGVVEDKENFILSRLSQFRLNILDFKKLDNFLDNKSVRVGKTPTTDIAIIQSMREALGESDSGR